MSIDLIRRPKLRNPFAFHYGVMLRTWEGEEIVYDLDKAGGIRWGDVDSFLRGLPGEVVRSLTDLQEVERAHARLDRWVSHPHAHAYDLLRQNCEHFARYVVTGRIRSSELGKLGLVVAGLFVGLLAIRNA